MANQQEDNWVNALEYPWPSGPYIPHEPTVKQDAFLWYQGQECMFGGSAGPGKSDALLMAALQYIDVPGYAALLLRKTYTELRLENALLDRSLKWLSHTDAVWNGEQRRWTFPSTATLTFGFLQKTSDRARYQSSEYQYIGFDELTAFEETDYRFMFSRLRRVTPCGACSQKHNDDPEKYPEPKPVWDEEETLRCDQCGAEAPMISMVPVRMRAATNPGGPGHRWVYDRFIKPWQEMQKNPAVKPNPDRIFIPAKLDDNPHIDQVGYRRALGELEPELVQQLLDGNWEVRAPGFWMIPDHRWIDAAVAKGQQLWIDHITGKNPLPVPRAEHGGRVGVGISNTIDWGEHTQSYVVWPLGNGGIFIPPSEVVSLETDPAATTKRILEVAMAFEYPLLLTLYDAAGIQSQRTYNAIARRIPRYKWLWTRGVPFANFKRESINYIRVLLRRCYQGEEDRILAIHPANKELIRQLKNWQKKSEESEEALKEDDHGPDAIVAGIAPTAREYRAYIEEELAELILNDEEPYELGVEGQGGVKYVRS